MIRSDRAPKWLHRGNNIHKESEQTTMLEQEPDVPGSRTTTNKNEPANIHKRDYETTAGNKSSTTNVVSSGVIPGPNKDGSIVIRNG